MNERISREQMLMDVAKVVARRGTCSRAQVGVVFAREGRILATGYNGAPRGIAHCTHESYQLPGQIERDQGDSWYHDVPVWVDRLFREGINFPLGKVVYWDGQAVSNSPKCTVVEHAERNAIAFSAREGIRLGNSDVYCTHAPCEDCARALLGTGIDSLTFETPYRLTQGVELLRGSGVEVMRLWPDGTISDDRFAPR